MVEGGHLFDTFSHGYPGGRGGQLFDTFSHGYPGGRGRSVVCHIFTRIPWWEREVSRLPHFHTDTLVGEGVSCWPHFHTDTLVGESSSHFLLPNKSHACFFPIIIKENFTA